MSLELSIKDKLELKKIDLISPDVVVKAVVEQVEKITDGMVKGEVEEYSGAIHSYTIKGYNSLKDTLAIAIGGDEAHDIQKDLGKIGYTRHKYECYLTAPKLPNYKFRIMFFEYGIGGYPVTVVLEKTIARQILKGGKDNPETGATSRDELEELLNAVFSSDRIIGVIQELINATQIAANAEQMQAAADAEN